MPYCNECGDQYSLGQKSCSKCGALLPVRAARQIVVVSESKKAKNPSTRRFAAGVLDLAIAIGIFAALFFSRRMLLLIMFRRGLAILLPHLYLLLKDSVEGKSVGKLLMGVVVLNESDGKAAGPLDSIIRNWYLAVPFLGPTLIAAVIGAQILSGRRQRMGDVGATTAVITDSEYQARR